MPKYEFTEREVIGALEEYNNNNSIKNYLGRVSSDFAENILKNNNRKCWFN